MKENAKKIYAQIYQDASYQKLEKKKWVIFYFLAKGQKVNIAGFVTRTISVADTQLCCCSTEAS